MVIIDSTVWIDYFRGTSTRETEYLDREINRQRFGLTDLILCETLQGIKDQQSFESVLRELHEFGLFETGGTALAIEAARNFRRLRQQGQAARKTIDCLIAAVCLLADRDFDLFETFLGLVVNHP